MNQESAIQKHKSSQIQQKDEVYLHLRQDLLLSQEQAAEQQELEEQEVEEQEVEQEVEHPLYYLNCLDKDLPLPQRGSRIR
jgi:hypothetical protein